jgi:hypothetical protein
VLVARCFCGIRDERSLRMVCSSKRSHRSIGRQLDNVHKEGWREPKPALFCSSCRFVLVGMISARNRAEPFDASQIH